MSLLNPLDIVPRTVDGLALYDLGHGAGQEEPVLLMPALTEPEEARLARHGWPCCLAPGQTGDHL